MKTAYIRYYLSMLYLMNLDVARYAFDTTLPVEARCLSGIGMGIGLVNLWLALRLDALVDQAPELPAQAVRINVGFSLVWNLALVAVGSAHPVKLALGLALGAIALKVAEPLRAASGGSRPQLATAA